MSERLTDKALAELEDIALFRVPEGCRLDGQAAILIRDSAARRWFVNLVLELRARRAADPSPEDIAAVREYVNEWREPHAYRVAPVPSAKVIAVLARLLASGDAPPEEKSRG